MSLKLHFLDCHLDLFSENLCTVSDEHSELLLQHISTIDRRYQGKWRPRMLADYCCTFRRDVPQAKYGGKSSTVTFC